jgi:hypothetical protein
MAFNPVISDDNLALLKQHLGLLDPTNPDSPGVSEGVMEADPALAIQPDSAHNETDAKLRQHLGLQEPAWVTAQRQQLQEQDEAVNKARIDANPEVSAQADRAQADKIALAVAPINAKAQADAAAAATERQAQQDRINTLMGGGGGQPAGQPGQQQGFKFKPSVNAKGEVSFAPEMQTAQQQTQAGAAQHGLSQLDDLSKMIDDLDGRGLLGPFEGPKNEALTTSGWDKYLMNSKDSSDFTNFRQMLSLTKSNMGYVHGGTRGGSSQALLNRFDKLVNTSMSRAGMQGTLKAYKSWLSEYANVPNDDVAGQEAVSDKYLAMLPQ